jgi:hypothetical protein
MSDRPPVVNFSTPYNPLADLNGQRQRLRNLVADIESSMADVRGYAAQGERDAGYAVAWAATIMMTDILRIGLSAVDKRAKLLFQKQDEALAFAGKVLAAFGGKPLATKSDLLKGIDPSLKNAVKLTQGIRDAQAILKKANVQAPKQVLARTA